jgi:uncharacterized protein (UPF0332 family)
MTNRETLFRYRLKQAEETLDDARMMLTGGAGARSIVNRSYYAMFYAVLALLLHENVEHTTSRHSGIILIFDKTFVHTGKLRREYSRMLHHIFESRQEADYKEFVEISAGDAAQWVQVAEEFMAGIKTLIEQSVNSSAGILPELNPKD